MRERISGNQPKMPLPLQQGIFQVIYDKPPDDTSVEQINTLEVLYQNKKVISSELAEVARHL